AHTGSLRIRLARSRKGSRLPPATPAAASTVNVMSLARSGCQAFLPVQRSGERLIAPLPSARLPGRGEHSTVDGETLVSKGGSAIWLNLLVVALSSAIAT